MPFLKVVGSPEVLRAVKSDGRTTTLSWQYNPAVRLGNEEQLKRLKRSLNIDYGSGAGLPEGYTLYSAHGGRRGQRLDLAAPPPKGLQEVWLDAAPQRWPAAPSAAPPPAAQPPPQAREAPRPPPPPPQPLPQPHVPAPVPEPEPAERVEAESTQPRVRPPSVRIIPVQDAAQQTRPPPPPTQFPPPPPPSQSLAPRRPPPASCSVCTQTRPPPQPPRRNAASAERSASAHRAQAVEALAQQIARSAAAPRLPRQPVHVQLRLNMLRAGDPSPAEGNSWGTGSSRSDSTAGQSRDELPLRRGPHAAECAAVPPSAAPQPQMWPMPMPPPLPWQAVHQPQWWQPCSSPPCAPPPPAPSWSSAAGLQHAAAAAPGGIWSPSAPPRESTLGSPPLLQSCASHQPRPARPPAPGRSCATPAFEVHTTPPQCPANLRRIVTPGLETGQQAGPPASLPPQLAALLLELVAQSPGVAGSPASQRALCRRLVECCVAGLPAGERDELLHALSAEALLHRMSPPPDRPQPEQRPPSGSGAPAPAPAPAEAAWAARQPSGSAPTPTPFHSVADSELQPPPRHTPALEPSAASCAAGNARSGRRESTLVDPVSVRGMAAAVALPSDPPSWAGRVSEFTGVDRQATGDSLHRRRSSVGPPAAPPTTQGAAQQPVPGSPASDEPPPADPQSRAPEDLPAPTSAPASRLPSRPPSRPPSATASAVQRLPSRRSSGPALSRRGSSPPAAARASSAQQPSRRPSAASLLWVDEQQHPSEPTGGSRRSSDGRPPSPPHQQSADPPSEDATVQQQQLPAVVPQGQEQQVMPRRAASTGEATAPPEEQRVTARVLTPAAASCTSPATAAVPAEVVRVSDPIFDASGATAALHPGSAPDSANACTVDDLQRDILRLFAALDPKLAHTVMTGGEPGAMQYSGADVNLNINVTSRGSDGRACNTTAHAALRAASPAGAPRAADQAGATARSTSTLSGPEPFPPPPPPPPLAPPPEPVVVQRLQSQNIPLAPPPSDGGGDTSDDAEPVLGTFAAHRLL
eukprot:TRINITY_DN6068_c0_g1_i2.p1 TRINITY_DN6068_c0_g1~~TRINITY_DN6068_c0_g1_i2.p1  ORF type:complete len:1057 (+),score=133.52 TRINITY_DN6068_c0_g1_i2:68-3172(+)